MLEDTERILGLAAVSAAAHIFIFVGLGFAPTPSEALMMHNLEFEVVKPQELEPIDDDPKPEKEVEEPRQMEPKPVARVRQKTVENPVEEPPKQETPQSPAEAEEAPVEFPGLTLTSGDGVASWSTVVGSGNSFTGPVVAPRKKTERALIGSGNGEGKGGGGLSRVARKDLSRPPVQPENMDQILVNNYPLLAKRQGIEGNAVIRVRITPGGQVAKVTLVKETYEGFGEACEKTVKSGQWRPKLDKLGRPVFSDITYTCRFEVGY
ncbi:MAG: TonB family protein [Deltaproteobacteria bacterium]|nr:TonB family protein [Deltaproteobacteria bacterium]